MLFVLHGGLIFDGHPCIESDGIPRSDVRLWVGTTQEKRTLTEERYSVKRVACIFDHRLSGLDLMIR